MKNVEVPARSSLSALWDNLRTIIYAILIALGFRTVAFEAFNIPSGSMKPTLLIGDYLFVSKFSYGYSRWSLPGGVPVIPGPGRLFGAVPARGDVVVFTNLKDDNRDYIKRVIGLPGDTVQMRGGRLFLNGQQVPRELVRAGAGFGATPSEYVESLPGGSRHLIWEFTDTGPVDNTEEYRVPAGHLFLMGDNRDESQDSRFLTSVGYVPVESLVGRARVLFFSIDTSKGSILAPWTWPSAIRFDRLFQSIN